MEPLTRQQIARKQDWMDRYLRARRREALTARTLEEARSALGWDTPQLCRVLEQLQAELTRYLTE